MPALDFTEIAPAQAGTDRDQFELFAREFLVAEGFEIAHGPDRGADNGRDLIVEETRRGPGGATTVHWLVSCKHKAHSGASVTPADEDHLRDRLETHSCTGFIAFYSTLPSSGLATRLAALRSRFDLLIYDKERIERQLLENPRGRAIAARFFPLSYQAWIGASQLVRPPTGEPNRGFFLREPHTRLPDALAEAKARDVPVFAVIYDPAHPSRSKLDYSLGYFMEYHTTKRLVDDHFVSLLGPSSDPALAALVPDDEPLENCLWVVLKPDGTLLQREGVYANPDVGLQKVRARIKLCDVDRDRARNADS